MTRAAADRTGAKALVRTLRDLGAPRRAERALAAGPQGHDLARAVAEILAPAELILLHPTPASARARFRCLPDDLASISHSEPESRDLILLGGGFEASELAFIRELIAASVTLLRPGGMLAAAIDTLAAPAPDASGETFDHLLFPQLAQQGALGEIAQARAPLPAGAWMLMLQGAGFEVIAETVAEQTEDLDRLMAEHAARLATYDRLELAQGRVHVLARKPGGSA